MEKKEQKISWGNRKQWDDTLEPDNVSSYIKLGLKILSDIVRLDLKCKIKLYVA